MKKWLVGAVAASGLLLAGCSTSPEVASTEAGRVREDELYERMKNEMTQSGMTYGEQMLQQILLEDILENAYSDEVSDEDVEEYFEREAEMFGGVEEFEELLEMQGMSADDVRENLRSTLYVRRAIEDHVDITEEDIEQAYEEYQINSTVAHILVEEEELAEDIISQLNDGAEFGDLVEEHSVDYGTVPAGGEIELVPGQTVPEFEEAAVELEEGEITQEPVESQFGYHVIKMVEVGEKGSLEEERETIENLLIESYLNDAAVVQEAVSVLVQDANVQIADDELSGALQQFLVPSPEPTDGPLDPVEEGTDDTDADETDDADTEEVEETEEVDETEETEESEDSEDTSDEE